MATKVKKSHQKGKTSSTGKGPAPTKLQHKAGQQGAPVMCSKEFSSGDLPDESITSSGVVTRKIERKRKKIHIPDFECDFSENEYTETSSPTDKTVMSSGEDEVKCKICKKTDNYFQGQNQWIQFGGCKYSIHRQCSGLQHHMKWKKVL
ncbi:hypothetical protein DPMN_084017 [Dreissena polymorpha]|uniref:Uncharacterized protein n=1 Tax=Dreissena polymorpha TaxID=45954 RepID=A0A9D4BBN9_DREPO|nr:hypothetical protein DPMN_084017 [Dreissena polymorpha]